jgi:hypothetical protein
MCRACARYTPGGTGACEAFPGGIPLDILVHGDDHREPFPGDKGVRFLQGQSPDQIEAFQDWQQTFGGQ